jgi:hypothetical protein
MAGTIRPWGERAHFTRDQRIAARAAAGPDSSERTLAANGKKTYAAVWLLSFQCIR